MSQDVIPIKAAELLRETTAAQHAASDPLSSAWVGANAGAGKTHVLKMRVLRLLLAGVAPERILCLTYTKAAAAEMAQRVFRELADWSTTDSTRLVKDLTKLLARPPSESELEAARQLFARAIETPGGLKVQTIHAFCERLLQRFPLEANVPPGFTILDDATAAGMLRDAIDHALAMANANPSGPMARAVRQAVAFAADEQFDKVLADALRQRDWIAKLTRIEAARGNLDTMPALQAVYLDAFGISASNTEEELSSAIGNVLSDAQLAHAAHTLRNGKATDEQRADAFQAALARRGACCARARAC